MEEIKVFGATTASVETIISCTDGKDLNVKDFDAKKDELFVHYVDDTTIIYVGVGDNANGSTYRNAITSGVKKAISLKRHGVSVMVPDQLNVEIVAELVVRASYSFDKYKSEKSFTPEFFELVTNEDNNSGVDTGHYRGDAINYARDLQNENSDIITPEYILDECIKLEEELPEFFDLSYLSGEGIKKHGLGLIDAVGRGSHLSPYLIILTYTGDVHSDDSTAIVGKGVTFDSGGHSLKPSDSMLDMRMDMSGASAVLGFMQFVAKTKPTKNFDAVIPTCHNAISSTAFNVGDIVTSYSGKSVEIHNTDAEGRLILADAISYVVKNYKPTQIVDIATLTGAIVVALGENTAGMFTNNLNDMSENLFNAGERCDERLWTLPLRDEHRDAMKGKVGDLRNMSNIGRQCGSTTAAAFLENFVEDTPWVHLDIAGTAMNKKDGGTGFGTSLLIEWLC